MCLAYKQTGLEIKEAHLEEKAMLLGLWKRLSLRCFGAHRGDYVQLVDGSISRHPNGKTEQRA